MQCVISMLPCNLVRFLRCVKMCHTHWCHSKHGHNFPYMLVCQTCVCGMPSMVACQIYFLPEQSQIVLACARPWVFCIGFGEMALISKKVTLSSMRVSAPYISITWSRPPRWTRPLTMWKLAAGAHSQGSQHSANHSDEPAAAFLWIHRLFWYSFF